MRYLYMVHTDTAKDSTDMGHWSGPFRTKREAEAEAEKDNQNGEPSKMRLMPLAEYQATFHELTDAERREAEEMAVEL